MTKKLLSVIVALVMVIGLMPAVGAAGFDVEFSDMPQPGHWSRKALESAVENDLLRGANGKIMPEDPLTRAQMAAIIVRAFGATEEADISSFIDVRKADWFASDIAKAYKMGVMQGYSEYRMAPNDNITREQAFTVLGRALKLQESGSIYKDFDDLNEVSDFARGYLYTLVNEGYIQGSNNKLNPKGKITREEFAQVMYNLIQQYIREEGEYTEVADGNVMITAPGVTFKDLTVDGDLIIGDGVGDGDVILEGVTVTGRMVVRGGGENSIIIRGKSNVANVIVSRVDGVVRVKVEDGADVEVIVVDDGSDDIIIEGTVGAVEVKGNVTVTASNANIGSVTVDETAKAAKLVVDADSEIESVEVKAQDAEINVEGTVKNVKTTASNTVVTGKGTVEKVEVKQGADGTKVETPKTQIAVDEGVEGVTAGGGKEVKGGETVENNEDGSGVSEPPADTPWVPVPAPKAINFTVVSDGQTNHDKVTVDQEGNNVTITGDYWDLTEYPANNQTPPSTAKWIGLSIKLDEALANEEIELTIDRNDVRKVTLGARSDLGQADNEMWFYFVPDAKGKTTTLSYKATLNNGTRYEGTLTIVYENEGQAPVEFIVDGFEYGLVKGSDNNVTITVKATQGKIDENEIVRYRLILTDSAGSGVAGVEAIGSAYNVKVTTDENGTAFFGAEGHTSEDGYLIEEEESSGFAFRNIKDTAETESGSGHINEFAIRNLNNEGTYSLLIEMVKWNREEKSAGDVLGWTFIDFVVADADEITFAKVKENTKITLQESLNTNINDQGDVGLTFDYTITYPDAVKDLSDEWYVDGKIELAKGQILPEGASLSFAGATYAAPEGGVTSFWTSDAEGASDRPKLNTDNSYTVPVTVKGLPEGVYNITFSVIAAKGNTDTDFDNGVVLDSKEMTITVVDPVKEAIKGLADGLEMVIETSPNEFTAKFNKDAIEVPAGADNYKIDVFISLDEALPECATITVKYNGDTAAKDISVGENTELRLSDLVLNGEPAKFVTGPVATWTVIVSGENIDDTVSGEIKSVVSNDDFNNVQIVLAESNFEFKVDTIAPELIEVTPTEGSVELAQNENFVLTVQALDTNLYELEVDHSFEGTLPEFSVYADAENPYGNNTAKSAFESQGVNVTYSAEDQMWTIDFGNNITDQIVEKGDITFYLVIKDVAGNQWGSMYEVEEENTFVYTVTKVQLVAKERISQFNTFVEGVTLEVGEDGKAKFTFGDEVTWPSDQEPNEGLGGDSSLVYVDMLVRAPEGATKVLVGEDIVALDNEINGTTEEGRLFYFPVAQKIEGTIVGFSQAKTWNLTIKWYNDNDELISVETLEVTREAYTID
ncbi:MAG: S-layer homology domain-containing protein [Eubacteriales bacterium]